MPHPLNLTMLLLLFTLLTLLPPGTHASPQPPLVPDSSTHLMPLHTLFLRQLTNLQSFTGNLGSAAPASPIVSSGDPKRPFSVDGSTFPDFASAAQRSCDDQANKCSDAANKAGDKGALTVGGCDGQKSQCKAAQQSAPVRDFSTAVASTNIGPDPAFPDFDLICDA